jgi:sugar phosphate isomerase/epimerase
MGRNWYRQEKSEADFSSPCEPPQLQCFFLVDRGVATTFRADIHHRTIFDESPNALLGADMTSRAPFKPSLSVSQELWKPEEEISALASLSSLGIKGIVLSAQRSRLDSRPAFNKELLDGFGLQVIALGSIVPSDTQGRIFAGKERKNVLLAQLTEAADLAGTVGATVLTLDAPELRNGAFSDSEEDLETAVGFFDDLSLIAKSRGVRFSIATCPQDYGCDFGRSLSELSGVLAEVEDCAGLGIHLATSSLLLEEGMIKAAIAAHGASCHHVDIADPFMRPMGSEHIEDHASVAEALGRLREIGHGPRWLTVSGKRPVSEESGALVPYLARLIDQVSTIYLRPIQRAA